MEIPRYLQILWHYKWVLIVGILVAAVGAFLAGFTFRDGAVVSRVPQTWPASTTMLLTSGTTPLYQSEIPGEELETELGAVTSDPVSLRLSDAATVYAYLAAGKEVRERVEAEIGEFDPGETITAVSRTTQPAGDETFPGRLSLPILDIVGYAQSPERAEEISRTAAEVFHDFVVAEQDARDIADELRIQLNVLDEKPAGEPEGSNPAIPSVVAFGGILFAFLVFIYLLHGIRSGLARRAQSPPSPSAELDDRARPSAPDGAPRPSTGVSSHHEVPNRVIDDDERRDADRPLVSRGADSSK